MLVIPHCQAMVDEVQRRSFLSDSHIKGTPICTALRYVPPGRCSPDRYALRRVAELKSNNLHNLVHVFWVGSGLDMHDTDLARHLITAG